VASRDAGGLEQERDHRGQATTEGMGRAVAVRIGGEIEEIDLDVHTIPAASVRPTHAEP
jgi:hypothetical protein